MASTYKPLPYIIEEVVNIVKSKLIDSNLNYQFGTPIEVVSMLTKMSASQASKDLKYPLIWLVIPESVNENIDNKRSNKRFIEDVTIIICNSSKKEYSSRDRYEKNIIPILRPIYELLMFYIENSGKFSSTNKFAHKYSENLQWGREGVYGNTASIFNDYIDAITIEGLDLGIIETCN